MLDSVMQKMEFKETVQVFPSPRSVPCEITRPMPTGATLAYGADGPYYASVAHFVAGACFWLSLTVAQESGGAEEGASRGGAGC